MISSIYRYRLLWGVLASSFLAHGCLDLAVIPESSENPTWATHGAPFCPDGYIFVSQKLNPTVISAGVCVTPEACPNPENCDGDTLQNEFDIAPLYGESDTDKDGIPDSVDDCTPNNHKDETEECDDGNEINTDGCLNTCKLAGCGDGFVQVGVEECDDGNRSNTDACPDGEKGTCKPAKCGDLFVQADEEACDDGVANSNTASCLSNCDSALCGDGFVRAGVEGCDDGNGSNADDCPDGTGGNCQTWSCGDGFIHAEKEACDDEGETADCNADCTSSSCGDGVHNATAGEACDDGDNSNTNACLTTCVEARCGDGVKWADVEGCDEGGETSGCNGNCSVSSCGDGILNTTAGEGCDDGNDSNGDSCPDGAEGSCQLARCGDGFKREGSEACDDGNQVETDDCLKTCEVASCGDGVVQAGEEACDDGAANSDTAACLSSCDSALCGDGFVRAGVEACDDGSDDNGTDGYCSDTCDLPPGMVSVSAGVFKYGPAKDTQSAGKFFIDIHEVTAGEYKACVDDEEAEEACDYSGTDLVSDRTYDNSKDDHPVNYVNWFEAVVYCTWKGRRLPTEFEWEKAARGTDGLIYPWGDTPVPDCTRAVMFGCDEDTQSAGRLEQGKSPYGAYDMIGNVYEWTNSWWDGDNNTRVLRGGWFNSSAGDLLSSGRIEKTPFGRYNLGGFRCALSF